MVGSRSLEGLLVDPEVLFEALMETYAVEEEE